jgi:hypothetical protein
MDSPVIHGDPLSVETLKDFRESVMRSIQDADEELRYGPKRRFLVGATEAGFTTQQAEFLWNHISRERRLF